MRLSEILATRPGSTAPAESGTPVRSEASIRIEPIVFGEEPQLLGVLTAPEEAASSERGIVLCAPLFHQNICSYRPLRNLGVRLAQQGFPVLRFDWPGCGDSGDVPFTSISTWTASVHDAIGALRESSGVTDVVLAGLRVGATLAFLGALAEPGVSEIAMLGPYVTGRSYLRELRSFEAMAQHVFSEPERPPPALPEGAMEAGGFLLSQAEVSAIEGVDLLGADAPSGRLGRALVVAAQPDRAVSALVDALTARGVDVDYAVVGELARAWDGTLTSYMPATCSELVSGWLVRSDETFDPRGR